MKKRILDYLQLSLQGIGIASLGTLNIFQPKVETLVLGVGSLFFGLLITIFNKDENL